MWIWLILAVIAFFATVLFSKKKKMSLMFVSVVALFVCVGFSIYAASGTFRTGKMTTERFESIRGEYLAKYLNEHYAGKSALVIIDTQTTENIFNKKMYDAFLKELKSVNIVATETLQLLRPSKENPMPREEIPAYEFNQVFTNNKNVDLIICFSELPGDLMGTGALNIWGMKDAPKLVLVARTVSYLKPFFEKGAIAGAIVPKQNYNPETKIPSKFQDAFDSRYIMVTPENLEECAAKYDFLFREVKKK